MKSQAWAVPCWRSSAKDGMDAPWESRHRRAYYPRGWDIVKFTLPPVWACFRREIRGAGSPRCNIDGKLPLACCRLSVLHTAAIPATAQPRRPTDRRPERKSAVEGKRVSVRVNLGGS